MLWRSFVLVCLLGLGGHASAAITQVSCAAGGSGRIWCEEDFFGACETGTVFMDIWVDETSYYELRATLYTNDSGDHQLNESFYLLVKNSSNPAGYPTDPNCNQVRIIEDGSQDQLGSLGIFYLVAGEANHLQLAHYCLLYNQGQCTQFFHAGGEGGGGCRNCESVGFNYRSIVAHSGTVNTCYAESGGGAPEVCDGVDNDCDGLIDEDEDGDGYDVCDDCAPEDSSIHADAPELCDGIDNNCSGEIDEGLLINACGGCVQLAAAPGESCGVCGVWSCDGTDSVVCADHPVNGCGGCSSAEGQPGEACGSCGEYVCSELMQVVCLDPGANGCGACGEVPVEFCDGIDNDCDGLIDENQVPETCNGVDDNCNNVIDEGELCEEDAVCMNGRCVLPCNEGTCHHPGEVCVDGLCQGEPCPDSPCPMGEICQQASCVDPCTGVDCPEGSQCQLGKCEDPSCHTRGCPQDLLCIDGNCVPDLCQGVACQGNSFCRQGDCVASCAGIECGPGNSCVDGLCIEDSCAEVQCGSGHICADGNCVTDPCVEIVCPGELLCRLGTCKGDPCENLHCPAGQICTPAGQCTFSGQPPEPEVNRTNASVRTLGCQLTIPPGAPVLFLILPLLAVFRRS